MGPGVCDPQVAVAVDGHGARLPMSAPTYLSQVLAIGAVLPDAITFSVCPVDIAGFLVHRDAALAGLGRRPGRAVGIGGLCTGGYPRHGFEIGLLCRRQLVVTKCHTPRVTTRRRGGNRRCLASDGLCKIDFVVVGQHDPGVVFGVCVEQCARRPLGCPGGAVLGQGDRHQVAAPVLSVEARQVEVCRGRQRTRVERRR